PTRIPKLLPKLYESLVRSSLILTPSLRSPITRFYAASTEFRDKPSDNVILIPQSREKKNLESNLDQNPQRRWTEMFRFAQFATGRIRRGGHDSAIDEMASTHAKVYSWKNVRSRCRKVAVYWRCFKTCS